MDALRVVVAAIVCGVAAANAAEPEDTARRAAKAVEKTAVRAGEFAERTTSKAGKAIERGAQRTGEFVENAASKTGKAIKRLAE